MTLKLNAWQMVAALVVLFAAIILATRYAPNELSLVVSLASTAFAAIFLGRTDSAPAQAPALSLVQPPAPPANDKAAGK